MGDRTGRRAAKAGVYAPRRARTSPRNRVQPRLRSKTGQGAVHGRKAKSPSHPSGQAAVYPLSVCAYLPPVLGDFSEVQRLAEVHQVEQVLLEAASSKPCVR